MKEAFIRFMAPVNMITSDQLFRIIDSKIHQKYDKVHLLISSPGGSVFHGLSVFNYLKGVPIEVDTYNFGSVDSIGVVIYCAGKKRLSVPNARFLLHGVRLGMNGNLNFDEKELDEHLKSLRIDQENIAKVISDTCQKKEGLVIKDMTERTTLNPKQAKDYGLVHEISTQLLPLDADLSVIGEINPQQVPFMPPNMQPQAFTPINPPIYNI